MLEHIERLIVSHLITHLLYRTIGAQIFRYVPDSRAFRNRSATLVFGLVITCMKRTRAKIYERLNETSIHIGENMYIYGVVVGTHNGALVMRAPGIGKWKQYKIDRVPI